MTKFNKLTRKGLTSQAAQAIYDTISSGELKPGEKLPSEIELSEQLGVGRPTVREALSMLIGLGLIERGGYNCVVADTSSHAVRSSMVPMFLKDWETRELFEARKLIEYDLVMLATEKATPEDIQSLRDINEKLKKNDLSSQEYWNYDVEFHSQIAQISGNSVMQSISEIVRDMFKRYEKQVKELHEIYTVTYNDHKDLIDAIESKDAARAREIINRSFSGSEYALYELNKNNG